ncbi:MAG: DUF3471 domain-containing protein, partial [Methanobacterium sp.]
GSEYYSNSLVTIFTSENIGIACFTNEGTYGKAFNAAMQYKLYYLLNGDDVTDPWPASKEANVPEPPEPPTPPIVPPLPLSTYIGVYSNSLWGNINITDNNDNLVCYYGNNSEPFNLTHWNGNTFVENNFYMRFNFTNISNGTAHQLTTMELNDYTTAPPSSAVFKPYK